MCVSGEAKPTVPQRTWGGGGERVGIKDSPGRQEASLARRKVTRKGWEGAGQGSKPPAHAPRLTGLDLQNTNPKTKLRR